ncbi:hypothetical protein Taro_025434 [Colocasia esculenta]|uniref:Uncharacterized protein n=1 Tax=Colocasia esculenta TaxID=4460 RepID=A0A843V9D7_COLES|nr:hypothetical protein [Colocasia esculenta]
MMEIPGTTQKSQEMTERSGSCRSHGPMERDPRLFYEMTCALLGPAYDRPLQVLGLSNNGKNPCTCRDMVGSLARSRYDRKSPGGSPSVLGGREVPVSELCLLCTCARPLRASSVPCDVERQDSAGQYI